MNKMTERSKIKSTIEDVAKHCGVSIATVSRVINQSSSVSEELTLRVRNAIKELEFTPRQWKELPTTKTIVIAVPDLLNPYYAEIVSAAQEEADRHNFNLVVLNVSEKSELQKQHLNLAVKWVFDGLIVVGTRFSAEDLLEIHKQHNLPIVLSRSRELPQFPCVIPDYAAATYRATQYLLTLNHTRIGYISGPPDWISSKIRLESITRALSEHGLTLPSELCHWTDVRIEECFQAMNTLLRLPKKTRPTAIIMFNDLLAISALRAIHSFGLRVPQDISVIGFDDIAFAAHTIPSLTTIAQPTYRIGQITVKKLVEAIENGTMAGGGTIYLECPLILRESTGPCSS